MYTVDHVAVSPTIKAVTCASQSTETMTVRQQISIGHRAGSTGTLSADKRFDTNIFESNENDLCLCIKGAQNTYKRS